jgi:ATP-dependent DNA helicase RecG
MEEAELLDIQARLCARPNETATVEFKSNLANPAEIGEYVSALANSAALDGHDRAWLVWGVENGTHEVKGTAFDPFSAKGEGNQSLVMWLQQRTAPRADFTFHVAGHAVGPVVMMEIHPARSAPVAFQNVRYIRIDSHKTKLSDHPDKEARLWAALGQKDDWTGELVPGATLDDLDPLAIEMARRRFTEYLVKSEPDEGRHDQIRSDAAGWDPATLLNKARPHQAGKVSHGRPCYCSGKRRVGTLPFAGSTRRSAGSCAMRKQPRQ